MKETKEHFIERINRYNRLHGLIPKEKNKQNTDKFET